MKRKFSRLVLYLFFLIFGVNTYAQGVWKVQNPLPTGEDILDIYCLPNSTNVWAVGGYGVVLKSVDGNSWSTLNSGTTSYLFGVQFINTNVGWVVGSNGTILKTTNGGGTWTAQISGTSIDLEEVHFINSNIGWAVGDQWQTKTSVILKTINGGTTWTLQTFTNVDFYDIFFSDSNNGWVVGRLGVMWKTTDGGSTWTTLTSGVTSHLQTVHFISPSVGWACGWNGTILKTTNGGTNWTLQTSGVNVNFYGSFFVNSNVGWVVGWGYILKTTDGGLNWVVQSNISTDSNRSICFANSTSGWVVGSKIQRTINGGSSWICLSKGVALTLNSIKFVDENTGWAVGIVGTILKTANGGLEWISQTSGTTNELTDVFFTDTNNGWVVGKAGKIINTTNGGSTWAPQISNTGDDLESVYFVTSSVGWAVGGHSSAGTTPGAGVILKTINGGATWTPQTNGSPQIFNSVRFTDINNGFAVASGDPGTMVKTTNGGSIWTTQTINTEIGWHSSFFINANTGWVCDVFNILKTTDGGITWTTQLANNPDQLSRCYFYDANLGWATGATLLKTTDGGTTWTREINNASKSFISMHFLTPNIGWGASGQGLIMKYTNYSPTVQASNITITNPTYQSINVSWTRGNGNQNALFIKQASTGNCIPDVDVTYLPNATFGLGDQVGSTGWYCVYNGSGTSATINGLQPNTSYRIHVCEYNFSSDFTHYNISTATNNPITATTAIAPPQIMSNPASQILCESSSTTFSVAALGSSLSYKWQYSTGAGFLDITDTIIYSGSNTSTLIVTAAPANLTEHMYHCVVTNTSGSVPSSHAVLTVIPLPVTPETISGDQIVCLSSNYTYIVPAIQNASTYSWTFPAGFSGTSTNNSIDLSTAADAVAGNITVQGLNLCGSGTIKSLAVDVKHLPEIASAITGQDKVCTGSINIGYATSAITGADYYIWSLPFGATGTSTINTIMVNYGSDPLTGQIKVKGHNMCGDGIESILPLTVTTVPSAIGTISGSSNACKNQNAVLYTINPIPNAALYSWKLPPGVTGSNSTNSVSLNFGPDAYSGDLKVSGVNSCGTGAEIILPVTVNAAPDPAGAVSGPAIVCKGQTNVLYTVAKSERATTYIWDLPDGTRETTVTNKITLNFGSTASSGNLYVTPYNSCGAGNSSTLYIEVSSPPPPTITAAGSTDFCSGDSVQLSISEVTNTTYQWFKDGGTVGTSLNKYSAKESGKYTINLINSNGCASSSINSVTVQVNPVPLVGSVSLSGPTTFCQGSKLILSVNSTTGYIYNWSNESGLISGANKSSFIVDTTGIYKLEISNSTGCVVRTASISVTVKPMPGKPLITASDNYHRGDCAGETPIKLSIKSVAGYNYQWYKNGIPENGATLSSIEDYLSQGDYSVEADLNGCKMQSDNYNLLFAGAPDKPLIYAQGPTVWYLACNNTKASKYKWYCNNKLIEGANNYYYVANRKMGDYQVSIANDKGCYTRSDIVTIPTGITGIEDQDAFISLNVYPNPSEGLFTMELNNQEYGDLLISVLSQDGKELFNFKFQKNTDYFSGQIDLTRQPEGNYLIIVDLNKKYTVRKIIIE